MTLLQLQYFITVIETGNFIHAAGQAYTSQPTISRQMQMSEGELGCSLFNQNNKSLRLTELGRILYEGVKEAISRINDTLKKAKTVLEGKEGVLSISFRSDYLSEYVFFSTISRLRGTSPVLQIRSNKLFSQDQIKGFENESIDVAVGLEFPHWDELSFTIRKLKKVETLIVTSTNHRLAKKETLEYNDLCGETFFLTAPNGYQVGEIFKHRFRLGDVHQVGVSSSESAYFKVLSDNGLTISNPYDPVLLDSPHHHVVEFDSEYADSYVHVTNPDNTSPAVQLFLNPIQADYGSNK